MNKYSEIIINQLASSTQEEQYLLCCNEQYYEANLSVVELVKEIVLFRLFIVHFFHYFVLSDACNSKYRSAIKNRC
ncbi:MAG: hypothetical protein LBT43_15425 [Prevotella sp.]|nr:hypothetical protein [Prevotella sp.]